MQNRFGLPAQGWTYCPHCDQETMLATVPGTHYECPLCGLGMTATETEPGHITLAADRPLMLEEALRYREYLMHNFARVAQPAPGFKLEVNTSQKPPWRVRLCYRLYILIGKFFGCRPGAIVDKKTEVSNEQSKGY